MSDSIFDVIDRRFMSGNSVCVERVHIKSDEWTDLKYELFAAREESERVRQASLDVMMHFGDMKATKEKLDADLDRALARVAELRIQLSDMTGCSCDQENPCKYHAMVTESGRKHVLHKQAEAVESVAWLASRKDTREIMSERISELRKKADQMENTHD
ncbi:hypothetical protein [Marinobacter flavimaris]|uniref:hypothetical protein n=1 Tax=Marinobacter flavimaris TaxID=262076 RepID=UPI0038706DAB